jgi:hypothetical protein
MKKIFVLAIAMMAVVFSAKAETEFAYEAGAEVVSAYIWRGQYNGSLSFQPEALVGLNALDEAVQFRAGVWASLGASDWTFTPNKGDGKGYTKFVPEVDVILSCSAYGASVGFNHYYYCDGSNFFSWKSVEELSNGNHTSTTEVWAGYNFDHFFGVGAYINWYTTIAGNDLVWDENDEAHRAWSTYIELGYDYTWEKIGLTLGGQLGFSPWASDLYGNSKFAVTNISVKLNKEWEVGPCTIDIFAQGSLNPDGVTTQNAIISGAGDDKLYNQKLNAVLGFGVWF